MAELGLDQRPREHSNPGTHKGLGDLSPLSLQPAAGQPCRVSASRLPLCLFLPRWSSPSRSSLCTFARGQFHGTVLSAMSFTLPQSHSSHNISVSWLGVHYRYGNWGLERWCDSLKVISNTETQAVGFIGLRPVQSHRA